ncbi:MAG: methyltransferase domain-containing protein [Candidatus Eisenbacteria bacterium]
MPETATAERDYFYDRMVASGDWDDVANVYETSRRTELVFGRLLADVSLAGAQFLDAGSGGGHFSALAARQGARVVSMDMGLNLLAGVARRCDSRRSVGSTLQLPFADGAFDVVLSTEVLEHTPDPLAGLRELTRVVKPGGRLILTTPGRLWQPVVRAASALHLRPYQGRENFLWPEHARREVERQGLHVERFEGFNVLPLFHRVFDPLNRGLDGLGKIWPSICVNFAIRAQRPVSGR